jgi:hypothetical protein
MAQKARDGAEFLSAHAGQSARANGIEKAGASLGMTERGGGESSRVGRACASDELTFLAKACFSCPPRSMEKSTDGSFALLGQRELAKLFGG